MERIMHATDVAIVGGGQAGLAMSRCLFDLGIGHVAFERAAIGARWQSHAWDSLRLLTPNWMNALPGPAYQGDDPDGFMPRGDYLSSLSTYAASFGAPVMEQTSVISVTRRGAAFLVSTTRGIWRVRAVVVATGHCDLPHIPDIGCAIGPRVTTLHSSQYRSPSAIPDGGVLVVGASASGVQIADELRRSGRDVTLAVGRHTRLPRNWRGRDIFWWLDRMGMLTERTRDMANADAAKRQPSLQLAGRPDHANVDLATLQRIGVTLGGRVVAVEDNAIVFGDDLASSVALAEVKLERLLARIDEFARFDRYGARPAVDRVDLAQGAPRRVPLAAGNIRTIVWATGYRRSFPWLKLSALGPDGEIAHRDGVTAIPGLYALGFRLLRKRDSSFIGGVGSDALELSQSISAFLDQRGRRAA
jgi:putative flavoprotein involved in K+ transport